MESAMRPRVSKRDRKLHVSYELPHRVHCARIYPVTAPNGSTVVIYGYDKGVRVLWRGGRRRREHESHKQSSAKPNGNGHSHEIISLDDDDDDAVHAAEDDYEAEEEEQDSDCPYPTIIEDLEIEVGTNVLHVEVPAVHVSSLTPSILKKTAIVAIGSSDGTIRILQIPLAPPPPETKDNVTRGIGRSQIELSAGGSMPSSLAIKYLPADQSRVDSFGKTAPTDQIVVASVSRALSIWSVSIDKNGLAAHDDMLLRKAQIPFPAAGVAFHPSSRLAQVLVTDTSGAARIYDSHTSRASRRRPATGDSVAEPSNAARPTGGWVMTYNTAFHNSSDSSDVVPVSARRKKILDARWVISGKAILAVLEDGEWGIWDVTAAPPGKRVEDFAVRGFLGTSSTLEQSESAKPKRGGSKLAPMTPNTRKTKSEELFTGAPKMAGVAPRGGISVASNYSRAGQSDESVVIWYNSEIYSITSIQSFWQRSTTGASGGFGSLYAPGLSHITDINLNNEVITSVSHFSANTSAGLGQMNTQRDLLVSAEHRVIALQTIRPASSIGRTLFQQPAEISVAKDQQLLDAGAMDLDAMDRMLDDMAGGATTTRKVGFAA